MQDLEQKNLDYQKQMDLLKKQNAKLLEEKRLLEEDPYYLEKVGRDKMGLIKDLLGIAQTPAYELRKPFIEKYLSDWKKLTKEERQQRTTNIQMGKEIEKKD